MNRKLTEGTSRSAGRPRGDHTKKRITNRNEKKYYSVGSKTSPKKTVKFQPRPAIKRKGKREADWNFFFNISFFLN